MKKIGMLGLLAVVLAGCATVKDNYVPQTTQISDPPLHEVHTAALGEPLIRQGTATTTRGVLLRQENNIRGFTLSPGFYPQSGQDEKYVFTSFETRKSGFDLGSISLSGGLFGPGILPRAIRFDRSKQETCVIIPNIYGFSQPVCDTEVPFEFTERPFVSSNDFQQTLIYSGRIGDRIRVSYREFSNNMARSAFTNDAEYDLSKSNMIAYKGARIEVLEADNEKIRYRVLSNFNSES